jgi:aspartate aminotransferase-like enzyme
MGGVQSGGPGKGGGIVIRVNHMGSSKQKCALCVLESCLQVLV